MTVALIGTATGTSPQTITVPAGGVPSGAHIVVFLADTSPSIGNASIADTASNTYSVGARNNWNNSSANGATSIFRERTGGALNSGDSITCTAAIAGNLLTAAAIYITGLVNIGADGSNTQSGNASGAESVSQNPTQVDTLAVGCAACNGTQASLTQSAAFTAIPGLVQLTGPAMIAGWALSTGTSTVTYTATWGTASVNTVGVSLYRMTTTNQCEQGFFS